MKNLIIMLIVIVGFVLIAAILLPAKGPASGAYDNFAKCLAESGAVMYGAYWCPHCQNEKKAFGDSFRFVPYVECTEEVQKCIAAGIEGYPTWILPGNVRLEGEQGLQKLSAESGCPLP